MLNLNVNYLSSLKKKSWIDFIAFFSCLIFFPSMSVAADSTVVRPPTVTAPVTKITINVLHYYPALIDQASNILNTACPSSNGSLNYRKFYFQQYAINLSPPNTTGYFYFSCAESYSTDDPYYLSLVNSNGWVTCKDNNSFRCSTRFTNPPVISLVAHMPPDSSGPNNKPPVSTFSLSFNLLTLSGMVVENGLGIYANMGTTLKNTINSSVIYTWNYDPGGTKDFPVGATPFIIRWRLTSSTTAAPWGVLYNYGTVSPTPSGGGNYFCPPLGSTSSEIKINPATMFGQTCQLSCNGGWVWNDYPSYMSSQCSPTSIPCASSTKASFICQ